MCICSFRCLTNSCIDPSIGIMVSQDPSELEMLLDDNESQFLVSIIECLKNNFIVSLSVSKCFNFDED